MVRSWLSWTGNDRKIQGPRSWSVTNLLLATFGRSSSTKKTREVLYITAGLVCNMYCLVFVKLLKGLFWLVTSTLTTKLHQDYAYLQLPETLVGVRWLQWLFVVWINFPKKANNQLQVSTGSEHSTTTANIYTAIYVCVCVFFRLLLFEPSSRILGNSDSSEAISWRNLSTSPTSQAWKTSWFGSSHVFSKIPHPPFPFKSNIKSSASATWHTLFTWRGRLDSNFSALIDTSYFAFPADLNSQILMKHLFEEDVPNTTHGLRGKTWSDVLSDTGSNYFPCLIHQWRNNWTSMDKTAWQMATKELTPLRFIDPSNTGSMEPETLMTAEPSKMDRSIFTGDSRFRKPSISRLRDVTFGFQYWLQRFPIWKSTTSLCFRCCSMLFPWHLVQFTLFHELLFLAINLLWQNKTS